MVNFENGKAPYLSKQNLMKMQQDANSYADKDHKLNDSTKLFNENNIVAITLLVGTNQESFGGSYYYKQNTKVHLHLGINLNTDVRSKVFNMPTGFRPRKIICALGGGANGEIPDVSYAEVKDNGEVWVKSTSKYACIDIEYDAFN